VRARLESSPPVSVVLPVDFPNDGLTKACLDRVDFAPEDASLKVLYAFCSSEQETRQCKKTTQSGGSVVANLIRSLNCDSAAASQ